MFLCCSPPRCLTCPCYRSGLTPCIGIMTALSNVTPFDGPQRPKTVGDWLQGGSLLRPEVFHNRWRTDKDPSADLASYAFVVKRPRSASEVHDAAPILESDIIAQFNTEMEAIATLGDIQKQSALRQLKPVMGQFRSIVSRFVRDSMLMKTAQGRHAGRSSSSVIAKKTFKGKGDGVSRFPPKNLSPIGKSSIACAKHHAQNSTAKDRKSHGNGKHIPDGEKWLCTVCQIRVKNSPDSIRQHKQGSKHNELLAKLRHCEKCDVYFPNTSEAITAHEQSYSHGHQSRLEAEGGSRDGDVLAQKQRDANAGSVQTQGRKRRK
jgi:hypothetical protein